MGERQAGVLISSICKSLAAAHASEQGELLSSRCRSAVNEAGPAYRIFFGESLQDRAEIDKFLSDANAFFVSKTSAYSKLEVLNTFLASQSVLVGRGTKITIADIATFISVHDVVAGLAAAEQESLPHLFRWIDYVQNKEDVNQVYERIPVWKAKFSPPVNSIAAQPAKSSREVNSKSAPSGYVAKPEGATTKTDVATAKTEVAVTAESSAGKVPEQGDRDQSSASQDAKKSKQEKAKKEKPPAQKKEVETGISILDIRVGLIKKAWKHLNADALYVEEIDVGEGKTRQVVSGLAKYLTLEEMQDRRVVVLTNVKPGNVRDVLSSGLVLCASNADHSKCEPVAPPATAPIGERVTFKGHDGPAEEVLNPKKKQFEKIQPDLKTDASGVACYLGIPFTTSVGPCSSTILNGTVK